MVIKAVIFDCFGVVIGKKRAIERDYAKYAKELNEIADQTDLGQITRSEYNKRAGQMVGLSSDEVNDKYVKTTYYDEDVIALAKRLKSSGKYKVSMLSNVNRSLMDDFLPFLNQLNLFDDIIISSDVGVIKPDPAIFNLAADRLGVNTNQCVMIDDKAINIDGAKKSGMLGIVHENAKDTSAKLNKILEQDA